MRDCTAYLVYKGGVNFIDSEPYYVVPSTNDSLKIVGSTSVKTPRNKRKTCECKQNHYKEEEKNGN